VNKQSMVSRDYLHRAVSALSGVLIVVVHSTKYHYGDKFKECEIVGARSTHETCEKCVQNFGQKKSMEGPLGTHRRR
jgi:hypothetical protein